MREALERILAAHEPYPGVVFDRAWNIVAANAPMAELAATVEIDPALLEPPINLLRTGLHLRGGMTAWPGDPAASHAFNGLAVPGTPSNVALHVGIGDGQGSTDPAMRFNDSPITPVNFWSGSDGNYWDDERNSLSASLLPAGTTSRTNSQAATGDCLTWAYAALTYRNG